MTRIELNFDLTRPTLAVARYIQPNNTANLLKYTVKDRGATKSPDPVPPLA